MASSAALRPPGFCTSMQEGKPCPCKRYQAPETIIAGQPTFCVECAHGLSHHDGGQDDKGGRYSTGQVMGTLHGLHVDTKKLSEARMETNRYRAKGFESSKASSKPGSDKTTKKEKIGKVEASSKSAARKETTGGKDTKDKIVKIAKIVVMPEGMEYLTEKKFIPKVLAPDLKRFREVGLATSTPAGLSYPLDSGPARMFVFIRESLPQVFRYLSIENPWVFNITENDNEELSKHDPVLFLLFPQGRKLTFVTKDHCDGESCFDSKGRASAGWKEYAIWLTPQDAIPQEVYEKWLSNDNESDEDVVVAKRLRSPSSSPVQATIDGADVDDTMDEEIEAGLFSKLAQAAKRPLLKKSRPLFLVNSEDEDGNNAGPSGSNTSGVTTETATPAPVDVVDLTGIDEGVVAPGPAEEVLDGGLEVNNDDVVEWKYTPPNPWESEYSFDF
ncbi:hypothetical protein GSI_10119 [Ganoderma sinense ZZ0214-1]|uniref:Uncharacterized protein n=1 Tax=Ganoderma sinense ZZ0214-1 TaxID=1077348 RepID=A0A2G8RZN1_9APHY|nr:hypothetical protein GSI_10119 [Ganoderma sinense ZZ0214-1]